MPENIDEIRVEEATQTSAPGDAAALPDEDDAAVPPCGAAGPETDRDAAGRFVHGNCAALVVGARSAAFWAAHVAARRAIALQVIADAGFDESDAPRALGLAADGIAQAALLRDAAFERVCEAGGPLTSAGRDRRAFKVWLLAMDRLERHLRLVGLQRRPREGLSFADDVRAILARQAAAAGDDGDV